MSSKVLRSAASVPLLCIVALAQVNDETMRERLAKHAAMFVEYDTSRRLENVKPNKSGVLDLSINMLNDFAANPNPPSGSEELAALARRSDTVVVGTTVTQYSALTTRHTFIYSDWAVRVTSLLKNTAPVVAEPGIVISVTRPGGELTMQGQRVIAHDRSFPEFAVGRQYVFFLKALPESNSFRVWEGDVFDLSGPAPLIIADPVDPTSLRAFSVSQSTQEFIRAIEGSIAR